MTAHRPTSGPRTTEWDIPWPALLDLVTSTLMVFLLVTFFQMALDPNNLEAALTRARQDAFLQRFNTTFSREIGQEVISVDRQLNFLQITFSDRVLFASGDYRLEPAGRRLLAHCAEFLATASDTGYELIQVEGHTDDRPVRRPSYPSDNWELSAARAIAVVEYLSGPGKLAARSFSANGYAHHRPRESNRTDEGRAINRRIEIRLFFSGTEEAK